MLSSRKISFCVKERPFSHENQIIIMIYMLFVCVLRLFTSIIVLFVKIRNKNLLWVGYGVFRMYCVYGFP